MHPRSISPLQHARRGNAAIGFAVVGLFVGGLGGLALDLGQIAGKRAELQAIVDAAALESAQELSVAGVPAAAIEARATEGAAARAAQDTLTRAATFGASVQESRTLITVSGRVVLPSFLPAKGPAVVEVEATAENIQKTPLCILMSEAHWGPRIELRDQASMTAPGCLIQVNGDIAVESTSTLVGARIQVSGRATGATIPVPLTGSLKIPDPFSRKFSVPQATQADCANAPRPSTWEHTGSLAPGIHCYPVIVPSGQSLRLLPGDHVFASILRLDGSARLEGEDVALVFTHAGQNEPLQASDASTISLYGRRSGLNAGMVISFPTAIRKGVRLNATGVRNLTGVVYVPTGVVELTSRGDVAEASDWTVIVAEQLILRDRTRLVINKDYAGSDVPVPRGVGPDGQIALRR
jgi:Flp pilus assembly protein TadG